MASFLETALTASLPIMATGVEGALIISALSKAATWRRHGRDRWLDSFRFYGDLD